MKMRKQKILTHIFVSLLLSVLLVGLITGCGNSKKGSLEVYSGFDGNDIPTIISGFGKYFTCTNGLGQASNSSGEWVITSSDARYKVILVDNKENMKAQTSPKAFVITIYDDGSTVYMEIIYTAGASDENPTISNPNWIAGISDVTRGLEFTPNETVDMKKRAEQIAEVLYELLKEIEG